MTNEEFLQEQLDAEIEHSRSLFRLLEIMRENLRLAQRRIRELEGGEDGQPD